MWFQDRVFEESFKEDWRVFLDILKGNSRVLQEYWKEVQRVFQGNFKAGSKTFKEVSRVFKESIKCVSRKFLLSQGRNFGIYFRYMVSIDTRCLEVVSEWYLFVSKVSKSRETTEGIILLRATGEQSFITLNSIIISPKCGIISCRGVYSSPDSYILPC